MTETHELAVMCDTFYPLKLTKFAKTWMTQVRVLVVRGARRAGNGRRGSPG